MHNCPVSCGSVTCCIITACECAQEEGELLLDVLTVPIWERIAQRRLPIHADVNGATELTVEQRVR